MINQKDLQNFIDENTTEKSKKLEFKNLEKRMKKAVISAINDFNMIEPWETILLWVSWWKDSMVLWYLLNQVRRSMKNSFNIRWVYIFKEFLINCDIMFEEKRKYFEEILDIPLEKVNINLPADSKLNEGIWQSCQWCAYARRIAMMKLCQKYSASKIAFGHHMDDIVTTTFMNLITWRKLKVMPPINRMRAWDIAFIRPLSYIREKDIMKLALAREIPFSWCNCPVWEDKTRNNIKKNIVWENEKIFPNFVENTFWWFIRDFKEKNEKIDYFM